MTIALATPKASRVLLLVAACFVALAYVQWDGARAFAAVVGVALSLLNWLLLRWFTARIVAGSTGAASRAAMSLLLVGKIGLLIGAVYVLIQRVRLDPVGLSFGLGVLFVGPVLAALFGGGSFLQPPASAAHAARKEH